jgi:acyl transferase domain-containing protein
MAGRFPGAPDVERFWSNLREGVESITRFSDEELLAGGEDREKLADPNYVKARPILEDIEGFDAAFFGYTPREAEILDPQQRIFLECAFEALEQAGYDTERHQGAISVFAGASFSSYLVRNLYANQPVIKAFGDVQATIFNVQDSLVTMAGYKLNLRGPCCAVQTFCSTSLVAVHLACQSLLSYESDMALAGGATAYVPQRSGYLFEEGGIVSPDGHCRAFDARARGTVFGSGVGVVVLKRLADALADRDTVRAVIRGSAINNDGGLKMSYAAPGVAGQTQVIVEALAAAGVDPDTIGYVETHGTGTLLGDPAEVSALTKAFRRSTARKGFCAIGSVKTNVGHLDAAAGVTGLMKAVLCLEHGQIPPSLHFETPNPQIDFASSPFYVNTALRDWRPETGPRRAAVSAFGVGGTNAHVVLEQAPPPPPAERSRAPQLLVLSAATETALARAARNLAAHLQAHGEADLGAVAFTLQAGRRVFSRRWMAVCGSSAEAVDLLEGRAPERVNRLSQERKNPPVAFLFPGSPTPAPNAGRALYEAQASFRQAIVRCGAVALPWLGEDVAGLLYPETGRRDEAAMRLREPAIAEAALFALEYSLAQLWLAWGVHPQAMAGFGTGEWVAACLAECLSLEEALRLAVERGRAASMAPGGRGFSDACRDLRPRPPKIPFVSGHSGEYVGAAQASAPEHWHARGGPSAHSDRALKPLAAQADQVFLELGPTAALVHLVPVAEAGPSARIAIASLREPEDSVSSVGQVLEALGRLWLAGVQPDWAAVHAPAAPRRVPLPSYPFERQRHWVDPLKKEETEPEPPKAANIARWLYQPLWKTSLVSASAAAVTTAAGRWLVFADESGIGAALAERLRARMAEVVLVRRGSERGGDPRAGYRIDVARPEDYVALLDDLRERGASPSRVVHLWSVDDLEAGATREHRFALASERGFYSLLHLVQALGRPPGAGAVELTVVSSGLHDILDCEVLAPEKAPLLALATVAPQEYHDLRCRSIDVERSLDEPSTVAEQLLAEILSVATDPVVALRGAKRWTRLFEPLPNEEGQTPSARVRPGGTYLVTGGLGNVGFLMAAALVRAARVNLVLVCRSALPGRDGWGDWLESHASGDATSVRIKRVKALEAAGAEVLVIAGDVADAARVEQAIAEARARFGDIHGVVHAAGLLGPEDFGPIQGLSRAACERLFAAKVRGVLALEKLLADPEPDFWLLTSSLSAALGGLGYAAYAAGNVFLDHFAAEQNRKRRSRWASVDFDRWEFGRAGGVDAGRPADSSAAAITPQEGLRLLEHLLRLDVAGQVVVSTTPLQERLARWVSLEERRVGARQVSAAPSARPRPELGTAYLAPRDERERALAAIFEELLGVGPVGVDDDFFELGGHSLFAARALSRLRAAFGLSLPLAAFFEAPTVAGLAARVAATLAAREGAERSAASTAGERVEIEL